MTASTSARPAAPAARKVLARTALLAALVCPSSTARAASISVDASAAFAGPWGLTVMLNDCADELILGSPGLSSLSGPYEACHVIRAGGAEVVAPGATFRAGDSIVLENAFSVANGAPLTAAIEQSLTSALAWVEDQTPFSEVAYHASFYLLVDGLSLGAADTLDHFTAYDSGGARVFRLVLKKSGGQIVLSLEATVDGGGVIQLPAAQEVPLAAGWNKIETDWAAGTGDGRLSLSVNGAAPAVLLGLANPAQRVDSIRWGASGGSLDSTTGSLLLDEFSSWR